MDELISLKWENEGIAWLEMQDIEGRNGLTQDFSLQFESKIQAIVENELTKVVILVGLEDIFSSGATAETLLEIKENKIRPAELTLARLLLALPIPVISAAEGSAIGGGFALAMAADLIVLAEESRYGANFITLGFTPGMGITRFLEHSMSRAIAHELLYTGELRRGSEFKGVAGFNAVVPRSEVRTRAFDIALRISEHPRNAISMLKRTLSLPRRLHFEESSTLESLMHEVSFQNFDPADITAK
jgi:polyketide biosynthesis enoyl-CoA hydratase PksI